jgi:hypothetical protein
MIRGRTHIIDLETAAGVLKRNGAEAAIRLSLL